MRVVGDPAPPGQIEQNVIAAPPRIVLRPARADRHHDARLHAQRLKRKSVRAQTALADIVDEQVVSRMPGAVGGVAGDTAVFQIAPALGTAHGELRLHPRHRENPADGLLRTLLRRTDLFPLSSPALPACLRRSFGRLLRGLFLSLSVSAGRKKRSGVIEDFQIARVARSRLAEALVGQKRLIENRRAAVRPRVLLRLCGSRGRGTGQNERNRPQSKAARQDRRAMAKRQTAHVNWGFLRGTIRAPEGAAKKGGGACQKAPRQASGVPLTRAGRRP